MSLTVSTKGEAMYQHLKQELLSGEIKGGQRLVITSIAKKYDVSPMPVREAINRLQQEGMVDVFPHIGAVAKTTDLTEFTEMVEVRTHLEVLATISATPFITKRTLKRLEGYIAAMEKNMCAKTVHKYIDLDRKFHFALYESSPNSFLIETISSLWDRTSTSQFIFAWDSLRASESLKEHANILAAVSAKEADLAGELVRKHKNRSLQLIIDVLKNKQV